MGQLWETSATTCCFLLFLLLFLVAPYYGQPQNVAWGALSPDDRVGDLYAEYPMEVVLERGKDPRDLPVRRISGLHRFHQPRGYPRDVASGAGSAASQWVPDFEPWRNRMAVAPKIPSPRSQVDLGFEPEEYPRGAGGVRTAEDMDQKRGENHTAVAVLAMLLSLAVLAALAYLVKRLLMKRHEEDAMLCETGIGMRKEHPALLEKEQNLTRITIEIEDLSGKSNPDLKALPNSTVPVTPALFCQPPQRSIQPDFHRQSEIADDPYRDTSKRRRRSEKERRSVCCCGRTVKLTDPLVDQECKDWNRWGAVCRCVPLKRAHSVHERNTSDKPCCRLGNAGQ